MRISDWSSDVCSSDLTMTHFEPGEAMIRNLADDNKLLLGQLKEVKAAAEADGDIATSGLVDGWADETQQRIWFLERRWGIEVDSVHDRFGVGSGRLILPAAKPWGGDRKSTRLNSSH